MLNINEITSAILTFFLYIQKVYFYSILTILLFNNVVSLKFNFKVSWLLTQRRTPEFFIIFPFL